MKGRKSPRLAVDGVIVSGNKVLLIKRKFEPFAGFYALPGGFVEHGEKVEDACIREVKEETGLDIKAERLIGVYSDPDRDPRGHIVSVVFLCKIIGGSLKTETNETKDMKFFSRHEIRTSRLAFDHKKILKDAGLL
ncbi:MAG: NUDIX hydrolase [Candidatus Aenigmarchaeota archaeon]|nr:NUDIX hydrolase [Candidatus Aenigmarchaeota archaeon]